MELNSSLNKMKGNVKGATPDGTLGVKIYQQKTKLKLTNQSLR